MNQDRAIQSARAWIKNAGLYCERSEQVLDELFNFGVLRHWSDDAFLQADMVKEWQYHRARGIRAEKEALEYQRKFVNRPRKVVVSPAGGEAPSQTD